MRIPAVLLFLLSAATAAHAGGGPENVLVVVNRDSEDSIEIGRYYMLKREIPKHHVVHVRLVKGAFKEPTFQSYKAELEDPIRAWLKAHPKSHITTIVLTKGIPVEGYTYKAEGKGPVRSIAHMLALLEVPDDDEVKVAEKQMSWRRSFFHRCDKSIDPREPFEFQSERYPVYTVAVLNAFTVDDVKRMIDNSLASDSGMKGTVYLAQSKEKDPRGMYNGSYPNLQKYLKDKLGLGSEIVPHATDKKLLKNKDDVIYFQFGQAGWDAAYPALNKYRPGCVVDNLTSVALTRGAFIPPGKGGQTKMTHFLAAGASAVHGCVREPTTGAWDRSYIHIVYYLQGYNLIESFFMGHPWFPWMNLVAGDPLMQPFAQRPVVTLESQEEGKLRVAAKATRPDAAIGKMILYVDGVAVEEVKADATEFDLGPKFDPDVNSWKVVAVDDSRFRTQGFLKSKPFDKVVKRLKYRQRGKKITISGTRTPVFTYNAPTATEPFGRRKAKSLALTFEGAGPHIVELWVHNAAEGQPDHHRIVLPK